ncbi:MAG: hypothetical protein HDQ97_08130 [Lachnospiraceae bacterium]|nr:hypothetical protein [Lachnospiraceae bacterium]
MKFVKRISLFFIYPLSMFSLGFISNMAIMEFFYPGKHNEQVQMQVQPAKEMKEEPIEVSVNEEPVVTANTHYVVQEYNTVTGETVEEEVDAPDKFIGLDRDKLVQEIKEYNQNPSLTDLEKGFDYMELVSFSSGRVVVRKSYDFGEEEKGFFLLNENHYVVVYDHSLSYVYMNTDIIVEELPDSLQEEILNMKYVEDEGELYNFLESYSS